MRKAAATLFAFITLLIIAGCKPSLPSGIMSEGEMTDFLYEYHIMMAAAQQKGGYDSTEYYKSLYLNSLLEKYDLTKEEYDSTLYYYERHAYKLRDIYANVVKRLEKETGELGIEQKNEAAYMMLPDHGDTALIWHHPTAELLYGQAPLNLYTFHIITDSTTLPGDAFELNFETQFLVQEGSRNVRAYLVAVFDNDSAATTNSTATGNRFTKLSIRPNSRDSFRVKEIRGFLMFEKQKREGTNAGLKVVSISNLGLIRYHQQDQFKKEQEEQKRIDSLNTLNKKDTLKKSKDSLQNINLNENKDKPASIGGAPAQKTVINGTPRRPVVGPASVNLKGSSERRVGRGTGSKSEDRYDPLERQKKNQKKAEQLREMRIKQQQEQKIKK